MPQLGCASVPGMTRDQRPDITADTSPVTAPPVTTNDVWPVSTTWRHGREKIVLAPQATQDSAPKGHRFRRMPRRNPRDLLGVTMKLRGGSMGWVEINARGGTVRVPGDTQILPLLLLLNSAG